jgi:hypothetical protein
MLISVGLGTQLEARHVKQMAVQREQVVLLPPLLGLAGFRGQPAPLPLFLPLQQRRHAVLDSALCRLHYTVQAPSRWRQTAGSQLGLISPHSRGHGACAPGGCRSERGWFCIWS